MKNLSDNFELLHNLIDLLTSYSMHQVDSVRRFAVRGLGNLAELLQLDIQIDEDDPHKFTVNIIRIFIIFMLIVIYLYNDILEIQTKTLANREYFEMSVTRTRR